MKLTKKIANTIKAANSIEAILAIISKIIDMMDCDCFTTAVYAEFFTFACIKAIAIGEFDKLMFEYPARCKQFLATHGMEWDMIDKLYDEHFWCSARQCYSTKREQWNNYRRQQKEAV